MNDKALETKDKTRAEETANRLRTQILRGDFKAGEDLPGERELALRLGVSRLTLRAALTRLETEGLVKPVHGSGNRVLDFRETGGIELIGHLTAIAQSGRAAPLSLLTNLLELRRALAVEAIALGAQRATADDIAALRTHLEYQATLLHDANAYIAADLKFAKLLARASHNIALTFLTNSIVRVLEQQPGIQIGFLIDQEAALNVYRKFVSVMEARDTELARALSRRVMARFDRRLLERIGALSESVIAS